MIELGKYNTLIAEKDTPQGLYLGDGSGMEVLLPNAYVPEGFNIGDEIEVFVYRDSEGRPIATTLRPLAVLDEFATLEVSGVADFGAFFKWGIAKDLLVPKALQQTPISLSDKLHVVYILLDEVTHRLIGSTKISRYLDNKELGTLKVGDEVDLIVFQETDLGVKVIVNKKHEGLVYHDSIFKPLHNGDHLKGYVSKIRENNKLDISLEKFGYRKVEPGTEKILSELEKNNGFLPLHDKSDPEQIKAKLHMSKKVFKQAIGALYKQRFIRIEKDGIYLAGKTS